MLNSRRSPLLRLPALGLAAVLASAAGLSAAPRAESPAGEEAGSRMAETAIKDWPAKLKTEARLLIERYGEPTSCDERRLTWTDNGPWSRTVLHRDGITPTLLGRKKDHLEQTIRREIPADKVAELTEFDKRIEVDRAAGEMTSWSDSERMNFLALNLADDIINGQRNAADARAFSLRVRMLERSGKSSPYLEGLLFTLEGKKASPPAPGGQAEPVMPEKTENPRVYDDVP
jgi:hypothetical protein